MTQDEQKIHNRIKILTLVQKVPPVLRMLLTARETGSLDIEAGAVEELKSFGVLEEDESGVFLSEAAEELVDDFLRAKGSGAMPEWPSAWGFVLPR